MLLSFLCLCFFKLQSKLMISVCSMEFLCRSTAGDGPLVAFGGSDGVIRVLSMITWKVCVFPKSCAVVLL